MERKGMHVASVELCQQLYDLSGWSDTSMHWICTNPCQRWSFGYQYDTTIPAYDLGYLLHHLPPNTEVSYLDIPKEERCSLAATYHYDQEGWYCELLASERAERLEDAACLLAITLFQQGILRRDA